MQKLKAVISVVRRGSGFKAPVTFTLFPPKGLNFYGNGYHMNVDLPGCSHYVDVRNAGTIDLEKLARIWLTAHYGSGLKEVRFARNESNV